MALEKNRGNPRGHKDLQRDYDFYLRLQPRRKTIHAWAQSGVRDPESRLPLGFHQVFLVHPPLDQS